VAADEADETVRWLQVMHDVPIGPRDRVVPLLEEAVELRASLAKSYKTSKQNLTDLERKNQQIYRIPPGCVPAI
jgi:hypothetical protein